MTENRLQLEQKEKTAQLVWTGFILAFFMIQAILWTAAIMLTSNDESHAIIAGYDEKALHWDDQVARQRASEQLGWSSQLLVDPASDVRGVHTITLTLSDQQQAPVVGAEVELTSFHRARAGMPQRLQITEIGDGVYSGRMEIRKSGHWQFDGAARRGDETFLIQERQSLKANR